MSAADGSGKRTRYTTDSCCEPVLWGAGDRIAFVSNFELFSVGRREREVRPSCFSGTPWFMLSPNRETVAARRRLRLRACAGLDRPGVGARRQALRRRATEEHERFHRRFFAGRDAARLHAYAVELQRKPEGETVDHGRERPSPRSTGAACTERVDRLVVCAVECGAATVVARREVDRIRCAGREAEARACPHRWRQANRAGVEVRCRGRVLVVPTVGSHRAHGAGDGQAGEPRHGRPQGQTDRRQRVDQLDQRRQLGSASVVA